MEDTRHLLQIVSEENDAGPQPPGTIRVTLDISGMYSNVPGTDGMTAFEEAMDKRDKQNIPTTFLLSLVMLVLSCNLFVFDGVPFLQLFSVAMGTKVAATFACLFMGWLELKMLADWWGLQPYLWRRFIDDIWFLWRGSEE